jgi:hypothetical protein
MGHRVGAGGGGEAELAGVKEGVGDCGVVRKDVGDGAAAGIVDGPGGEVAGSGGGHQQIEFVPGIGGEAQGGILDLGGPAVLIVAVLCMA